MIDLKISAVNWFSILMTIATVMVAVIHVLIMYCTIAPFDMVYPQTYTIALKESHVSLSCNAWIQGTVAGCNLPGSMNNIQSHASLKHIVSGALDWPHAGHSSTIKIC
jgi:hypothetical protein